MFPSFDMDGKPAASYAEIGRRFDRRYRVRERKDDPFPPDMRGKDNPEREHGRKRVWHCSLAIKAGQGILTDQEWESVIRDYLMRMNIIDGDGDQGVTWLAVRHGLSANGNDHVHIMVQLAADDGWINPYHDRINAQRSCRRMEKSRPELVGLARSDTGTRVSWQYGQWRQWAEWKARNGYGDDMRLKRLRDDWADDARSRSLAVQEWRAAMENRPPFLDDGREGHPENLSTHDMERLVSEAFCIAANLNSAADDDEYRAAMREGLHTFDMLRERYGLTQDGLWITATDMNESPIPAHVGKICQQPRIPTSVACRCKLRRNVLPRVHIRSHSLRYRA